MSYGVFPEAAVVELSDMGSCTGRALLIFQYRCDADLALDRLQRQYLGRRYLELQWYTCLAGL